MKKKIKINEIQGHFVFCGRPIFDQSNNMVIDWIGSFVKLNEIKSIHIHRNEEGNEHGCRFYTYKDEWYACAMTFDDLTKEINLYLDKCSKNTRLKK